MRAKRVFFENTLLTKYQKSANIQVDIKNKEAHNMSILNSFNKLPRLVQIILLLIPGVNWITEVLVRVSACMHGKAGKQLIVLILAIIPVTGVLLGWADLISCLIQKRLILT